ncbi:MAG: VWA domain-containing protein [Dehalococcoidales bacterium]|nr:VWA domain-containing protein [Dehalococcoidales bacterium]
MENEKKTGLQISHEDKQEIAVVGGGIKILAAQQPIETRLAVNWGNVYVILDCSGSMKRGKLDQAREGVVKFAIDAFAKEYHVGLIKFSSRAELLYRPGNDIRIIRERMKDLRASGSTNMTAAIKMAHEELKGLEGLKAMVIATDGMPDSVKGSLEVADKAKADKIEILTIGTDDADKWFLEKLASRAELATKVSSDMFGQAITSASLLLMSPRSIQPRQGI